MINSTIIKIIGVLVVAAGIYLAGYMSRNGEIADLKAQVQVYKSKLQELADASKRANERVKELEAQRKINLSKLSELERELDKLFDKPLTCQGILDNLRGWADGHRSKS